MSVLGVLLVYIKNFSYICTRITKTKKTKFYCT